MTIVTPYGRFAQSLINKEVDLDSDALKVLLLTSAYTPDLDNHRYKSSLTGEVSSSGTGYTAGGVALLSPTVAYVDADNTVVFDAADTDFPGLTATARYAVIYDSTPGTDATRPLIALVDFEANVATTAGTLTIQWNATGILAFDA